MTALVEPPMAASTRMALWNADGVKIRLGTSCSLTISTHLRPAASAATRRLESLAGMLEAAVGIMPSASERMAIVEAVPISLQVPYEHEIHCCSSPNSSRPKLPDL